MRRKTGILATFFFVTAVGAMAQAVDPPSRVARLNYLNGPVDSGPAAWKIGPRPL